ncbi:hypothetical protein [Phaeobacter inhibens]|nr:hypothetical protein [Phaeobacter inhibens]
MVNDAENAYIIVNRASFRAVPRRSHENGSGRQAIATSLSKTGWLMWRPSGAIHNPGNAQSCCLMVKETVKRRRHARYGPRNKVQQQRRDKSMDQLSSRTVAVFSRSFTLPGFDEALPAGEYDIETELSAPPDLLNPQAWKASVLVHLHPRKSHPGLTRSLTVSLADLDSARVKDKLSGKELSAFLFEEMLADPMVRLVMQSDGVSETQIRHLYSGLGISEPDGERHD